MQPNGSFRSQTRPRLAQCFQSECVGGGEDTSGSIRPPHFDPCIKEETIIEEQGVNEAAQCAGHHLKSPFSPRVKKTLARRQTMSSPASLRSPPTRPKKLFQSRSGPTSDRAFSIESPRTLTGHVRDQGEILAQIQEQIYCQEKILALIQDKVQSQIHQIHVPSCDTHTEQMMSSINHQELCERLQGVLEKKDRGNNSSSTKENPVPDESCRQSCKVANSAEKTDSRALTEDGVMKKYDDSLSKSSNFRTSFQLSPLEKNAIYSLHAGHNPAFEECIRKSVEGLSEEFPSANSDVGKESAALGEVDSRHVHFYHHHYHFHFITSPHEVVTESKPYVAVKPSPNPKGTTSTDPAEGLGVDSCAANNPKDPVPLPTSSGQSEAVVKKPSSSPTSPGYQAQECASNTRKLLSRRTFSTDTDPVSSNNSSTHNSNLNLGPVQVKDSSSSSSAAWLTLTTNIKGKMSNKRLANHASSHSTTAIVETHSPSPSASSHHRTSRHHHKHQSVEGFADISQLQMNMEGITLDGSVAQAAQVEVTKALRPNNGGTAAAAAADCSKKERYRSLWGKVGKQGLLQAAVAKQQAPAAAVLDASGEPVNNSMMKWDQVLNPILLQQQRQHSSVAPDPYFSTTVGGEAGGGSGFFGQNNPTMECDCGDDNCPQCNLMLNMEKKDLW